MSASWRCLDGRSSCSAITTVPSRPRLRRGVRVAVRARRPSVAVDARPASWQDSARVRERPRAPARHARARLDGARIRQQLGPAVELLDADVEGRGAWPACHGGQAVRCCFETRSVSGGGGLRVTRTLDEASWRPSRRTWPWRGWAATRIASWARRRVRPGVRRPHAPARGGGRRSVAGGCRCGPNPLGPRDGVVDIEVPERNIPPPDRHPPVDARVNAASLEGVLTDC